jgi:enoyl-CoA hydratase
VTDDAAEAEALIERRGAAGFVTLNRPKALNALTLTMVRLIAAALNDWERDPEVIRVVLRAAGDKAFCAGGDIRRLYELGRAGDHAQQLTFWREEYQLNERIKTYPKPIVALIDGIVMGGGVGLSVNAAAYRIAGDRFAFAMPEVGIGLFPDVGATFVLPRLPHKAGAYLALTGLRAGAGDALALALVDAYVPSASFDRVAEAMEGAASVEGALRPFAAEAPHSGLIADAEGLEPCFSLESRSAILEALLHAEQKGLLPAARARAAMLEKSPTSQSIALRQMKVGPALDFHQALRVEFRIVSRVCRGRDFYEGVRALIVDKDNRPRWSAPPTQAEVDAYFAPLGDQELTFPVRRI